MENSNVSFSVVDFINKYKQSGILDKIGIEEIWDNYYNINNVMKKLVEEIGLEKLLILTKEFNEKYIEDLKVRRSNFRGKK